MTGLLASEEIRAMARERSVRGVLVGNVLAQAEQADAEERLVLEKALLLLLERFQSMAEDGE